LVGTLPNVEGMEHAQIVIIGPPALFTACSWIVTVDGADLYAIGNGEHAIIAVPVGERIIGVKFFSSAFRWEENTQTVTTEAGKVYYFRLDPRFGGVVFINRITTETGRELVCKTLRLP